MGVGLCDVPAPGKGKATGKKTKKKKSFKETAMGGGGKIFLRALTRPST